MLKKLLLTITLFSTTCSANSEANHLIAEMAESITSNTQLPASKRQDVTAIQNLMSSMQELLLKLNAHDRKVLESRLKTTVTPLMKELSSLEKHNYQEYEATIDALLKSLNLLLSASTLANHRYRSEQSGTNTDGNEARTNFNGNPPMHQPGKPPWYMATPDYPLGPPQKEKAYGTILTGTAIALGAFIVFSIMVNAASNGVNIEGYQAGYAIRRGYVARLDQIINSITNSLTFLNIRQERGTRE